MFLMRRLVLGASLLSALVVESALGSAASSGVTACRMSSAVMAMPGYERSSWPAAAVPSARPRAFYRLSRYDQRSEFSRYERVLRRVDPMSGRRLSGVRLPGDVRGVVDALTVGSRSVVLVTTRRGVEMIFAEESGRVVGRWHLCLDRRLFAPYPAAPDVLQAQTAAGVMVASHDGRFVLVAGRHPQGAAAIVNVRTGRRRIVRLRPGEEVLDASWSGGFILAAPSPRGVSLRSVRFDGRRGTPTDVQDEKRSRRFNFVAAPQRNGPILVAYDSARGPVTLVRYDPRRGAATVLGSPGYGELTTLHTVDDRFLIGFGDRDWSVGSVRTGRFRDRPRPTPGTTPPRGAPHDDSRPERGDLASTSGSLTNQSNALAAPDLPLAVVFLLTQWGPGEYQSFAPLYYQLEVATVTISTAKVRHRTYLGGHLVAEQPAVVDPIIG
jgi:hypothetical protein